MAESGQSAMKTRGKMWLSVAAWRDTCTMIIQDRDYISFCTNKAKVIGKGLNLMQQTERDRKAERNFINSACDALQSGDIEAEVLIEMDPSCYFVSNKKAKNRVPANFSSGNPNQEKIKDGQKHKLSSQITTKKTKRKKKVLIRDSSEEDSDREKIKSKFQKMLRKKRLMKTLLI